MKPSRMSLFLIPLLLAVGCSSTPTDDKKVVIAELDPPPENYKDLITDHLMNVLLGEFAEGYRPEIDFKEPYPARYKRNNSDEWVYGYGIKVLANTPVRYGGYINAKPYFYFMDRGRVRQVRKSDSMKKL